MSDSVRAFSAIAPARLHLGLSSFGPGKRDRLEPRHGGLGLMIAEPEVRVAAEPHATFAVAGDHVSRTEAVARRWAEGLRRSLPPLRLAVSAPPLHIGLGVGTQLALAVAAALFAGCRSRLPAPAELGALVGRGRRSSIGCHGFLSGGLVLDPGKPWEQTAPAVRSVALALPEAWRIVLFRGDPTPGVSGRREQACFQELGSSAPADEIRLRDLMDRQIRPAAAEGNFRELSAALGAYNAAAGELFAPIQGGVYGSASIESLVAAIRARGFSGVFQSSWGPTVAALCECSHSAAELAAAFPGMSPRIVRIARSRDDVTAAP